MPKMPKMKKPNTRIRDEMTIPKEMSKWTENPEPETSSSLRLKLGTRHLFE